jgi:hypothetical protein|tara:strand:- start:150 stop:1349 length:1200 start_codon:yes stop_codon:yes gene_type:complete
MVKFDFNKNITISVILSFCIFFLWKLGILYSYSLSPVVKENQLHIFADWAMPIKLAVCHKFGFNVFYPTSCLNYPFNYGNILLYIPYFNSFEKFYFFYIPIIICFLFVFSIVSIIKPKNFFEYFLLILIIFAPSSLLAIERGNNDVLIFLFIILIVYFNSSTLNFLILTLASLAKYYPLALIVNFFIEKKRSIKQIIITLLLFTMTLGFFFYFTGESLELIQNKMKMISPTWGNQFSIKGLPLVLKKLKHFDYSTVLFISYIFFIFSSIVSFKIFQKSNFISKVNISFFEEKLFILGGNLSISVYLISDNVHYREIFLILLLPFIMKLKDSFKIKIFKYLFYFILFRYVFFIFANYFIMFKKYFTFIYIKAFSDIVLVSLFTAICVIMNIEILKQFTKK